MTFKILILILISSSVSQENLKTINVLKGDKVDFYNNITGNYYCIKWKDNKHHGQRLNTEKRSHGSNYNITTLQNGAYYVSILKTTFNDSSFYSCTLDQPNGKIEETDYLVEVFDKIVKPKINVHYLNVKNNYCNITLECCIEFEKPVYFNWYGIIDDSPNQFKSLEISKKEQIAVYCSATTPMQNLFSNTVYVNKLCFPLPFKESSFKSWWDNDEERLDVTNKAIIYSVLLIIIICFIVLIAIKYFIYFKTYGIIIMPSFKQNLSLFFIILFGEKLQTVSATTEKSNTESALLDALIVSLIVTFGITTFCITLKFALWLTIKIAEYLDNKNRNNSIINDV